MPDKPQERLARRRPLRKYAAEHGTVYEVANEATAGHDGRAREQPHAHHRHDQDLGHEPRSEAVHRAASHGGSGNAARSHGRVDDREHDADHQMCRPAEGYDPTYGARPLKRAIQRYLQDPLAMALLEGEFGEGDTVTADVAGDELVFQHIAATPETAQAYPEPEVEVVKGEIVE